MGAVIPALNEEKSVAKVVAGLLDQRDENCQRIVDHVVVCDNGSTDRTAEEANSAGATVVHESSPGYGSACQTALQTAYGLDSDVVVFTDSDNAFDAKAVVELLEPIAHGADLVIGSRSLGIAAKRALSASQRVGNRVATTLIRLLWGVHVSDLGPYRAIRTASLQKLNMQVYQ